MTSRFFDLSDVLSITTGKLLSNRGIKGIYDIMGHITNDPHITTIGLSAMFNVCKKCILDQYPGLDQDITSDDLKVFDKILEASDNKEETVNNWVNRLRSTFGNDFAINPLEDSEPMSIVDDIKYFTSIRSNS